jgi:hypothetical protein
MQTLDQYYDKGRSLETVARDLSDPKLSLDSNKADVDKLVMNLVIKYAAKYFGVVEDDPTAIKSGVLKGLEKSDEDTLKFFANVISEVDHGGMFVDADDDFIAKESLADLRCTAAIVREIIFGGRFEGKEDFIGVDFGTGSSILMLASAIAAFRREMKRIIIVGFDIQKTALDGGGRCLRGVLPEGSWKLERADVLDPRILLIFHGLPISYWVSETFSHNTPKMVVKGGDLFVFGDLSRPDVSLAMNQHFDPFPQVLMNTVKMRPGFFGDVRNGKTAMFPDIVNGQYCPDTDNSRLSFRTGTELYRPLHEVGREFSEFEDFGISSRWPGWDVKPEELEVASKVFDIVREMVGKAMKKKGG